MNTVQQMVRCGLRSGWIRSAALLPLLGGVACGDLAGDAALPPNTQSPNTYNTPAGALGVYNGAKVGLQSRLLDIIIQSGLLTDELTFGGLGSGIESIGATGNPIDERVIAEQTSGTYDQTFENEYQIYGDLQKLRGHTAIAIGLLRTYAPTLSPALRGEMYTLQGFAELFLAELYCSGVPLSTLDFQGDFTYKPSSTADEVYQHAVALFDSALAISSDSASVMALAQVGKGRALLNRGQYTQAAQAVTSVPDVFRYEVPLRYKLQLYPFNVNLNDMGDGFSVAANEGGNGLPFSTTNDPRVLVVPASPSINSFGVPQFWPAQYPNNGVATFTVPLASGTEARLIEAEAALQTENPIWLTILNTLRSGAGLSALSDPGSDTARVTLLFSERAYWLFLTGHRQGDLRRLIRNYGRLQEMVYPTGLYFGGLGIYGSDVNFPIPVVERTNTLFHGCLDREA